MPQHPHMVLSISECEKLTTIPDKVTAVIATCQAPLKFLAWSVFSLLMRSKSNGVLEHICVAINGVDYRTGDPTLQDQKQDFLEDLRELRWEDREMPLTVIRAWSRVGHTHSMEMCLPWIHTEHYAIMHDDVIMLRDSWEEEAQRLHFDNENVVVTAAPPLMMGLGEVTEHEGSQKIGLPHMHTPFILCRKNMVNQLGSRWWGYHAPVEFNFDEWEYKDEFIKHHTERGHFPNGMPKGQYKFVNMDIGAWLYDMANKHGYEFKTFDDGLVSHFKAGSWDQNIERRLHNFKDAIEPMEAQILEHPQFSKIYRKHVWNSL